MKKFILPIALALSVLATPAFAADKVRIATEGAYAPWNFLDDDGKLAGFEIDLGNALCAEAKLDCEFKANEWDSIIPNLIAGNYDIIMAGMSVTEERKQKIAFSNEYFPVTKSMMAAESGKTFDMDNLKGMKIGVQGATVQADWLNANLAEGNTIKSFEKPDQSVADLMAGNIDLLLAGDGYLDEIVASSKGKLEFVGSGYDIGGGVAIGMRQADKELAGKFNAAIETLKANGTVDSLIKKYFKKGPYYTSITMDGLKAEIEALAARVKALESK